MDKHYFAHTLLHWYQDNKRDLPWRQTRDPYFIWLSEVILQQTRVKQGLPYYYRFIEAFESIDELAKADERDVLRLWQGLGYYSRARNMHQTAKIITTQLGGQFPGRYSDLLNLKGIGSYTAAAIASFAYNESVAVLDGNVFRVLARVFGIETDILSSTGKKVFSTLAAELLPNNHADIYNQAIMEFGALACTPVNPDCMFCPLANNCVANLTGRQGSLPVKAKKKQGKQRYFHYFVIQQGNKLYMKERVNKDIWTGLFDFYLVEAGQLQTLDNLADNHAVMKMLETSVVENESLAYKHVLTHQTLAVKFWHLSIYEDKKLDVNIDMKAYTMEEIKQLPKPILIDNYLNQHFF